MKRKKLKVLQRACDGCNACCTVFAIRDLKPIGEDCQHLAKSRSEHHCTIYETRPVDCREYVCVWRGFPDFGETWHRPDRLGVLFTPRDNKPAVWTFAGHVSLVAHETRPGAFEEPLAKKFMNRVAQQFVVFGFFGPLLETVRMMGPADKMKSAIEWCVAHGHSDVTGILREPT